MVHASLIFLIVAFVLFVLAALGVIWPKINPLGAGLAFLVLAQLVGHYVT